MLTSKLASKIKTNPNAVWKTKDAQNQYHVEQYAPDQFWVEDPAGGDDFGPFKTQAEAQRECDKRNQQWSKEFGGVKDSDSISFDKLMSLIKEGRIEVVSWIGLRSNQSHAIAQVKSKSLNTTNTLSVEGIPELFSRLHASKDSKTKDGNTVWKQAGIIVIELQGQDGDFYRVLNTRTGENMGDLDNQSAAIAHAKSEIKERGMSDSKTKDSDYRGYKVKDQIIKGFMIYKSDRPNIFTAKNENGEQYEGTMEDIKARIDAYWVKQDEAVMKQKVKDEGLTQQEVVNKIRSMFQPVDINGGKRTNGTTVSELKSILRGAVPQSQPAFVKYVGSLGFKMDWSSQKNAWVVHDSKMKDGAADDLFAENVKIIEGEYAGKKGRVLGVTTHGNYKQSITIRLKNGQVLFAVPIHYVVKDSQTKGYGVVSNLQNKYFG